MTRTPAGDPGVPFIRKLGLDEPVTPARRRIVSLLLMAGGCAVAAFGPVPSRDRSIHGYYYLVLVPSLFTAAMWVASRSIARGMVAVVVILAATLLIPGSIVWRLYHAGRPVPLFLQDLAIPWPQMALFGLTLLRGGEFLPAPWGLGVSVAFWLGFAILFGFVTRRLRSWPLVVVLAMVCIVLAAMAVSLIVPIFGWEIVIEGP